MTIKFKENNQRILTITAEDTVSIGELIDNLSKSFPNEEWRDFKIELPEVAMPATYPIYPVYPTYPVWPTYPAYPYIPPYYPQDLSYGKPVITC